MSPRSAPRTLPLAVRAALCAYGLAWRVALPGLKRNSRLREGWGARTLATGTPPKADLWLQAASGGEAYLAWELLAQLSTRLPQHLPADALPLRVLATTFTAQGLGVLEQARKTMPPDLELVPAYFPFDLPSRMERALAAVAPRAVVLLETELWPGLLAACRSQGVPALVLNGRLTPKSLSGYSHLPWLWRALAPQRILAVSGPDARRFGAVFGEAQVTTMPNIKFDRLRFDAELPRPEFADLLPTGAPFLVLGSVRRQEEDDALEILKGLLAARPGAVLGLFPRHMNRVEAWAKLLGEAGIPFALRSAASKKKAAAPGSVLLWDVFGELSGAFNLSCGCFLGGSLAELGGQNFLEPLACGTTPVIGPSWSNFAWVGAEIFEHGLVRQADDWQGVLRELLDLADSPPERAAVRARAADYAASRRGGAVAACQAIAECLISG